MPVDCEPRANLEKYHMKNASVFVFSAVKFQAELKKDRGQQWLKNHHATASWLQVLHLCLDSTEK